VYTPPTDHPDDNMAANSHSQHFFLGHDNDIRALAVCPALLEVDGQSFPAHSLSASGQLTSNNHGPYVCVWDSRIGSHAGQPELRRLEFPKSARGICALGFSPDGCLLTVVAMDNAHSVYVYDWRHVKLVGQGHGYAGQAPQV
jgi:WD40 repeat protein